MSEELKELRELIAETERFIEKYPDRFSLKMSLHSLKVREKELSGML